VRGVGALAARVGVRRGLSAALASLALWILSLDALRPFGQLRALASGAETLLFLPPRERFLHCGGFRFDRGFGLALLRLDAELPADAEATLELAPNLKSDIVNFYRFRAAYALAPRNVHVVHADLAGGRYRLAGGAPGRSEKPVP
jgi:hypothetical protein